MKLFKKISMIIGMMLIISSNLFAASQEIATTMSMQDLNKLTASDGAAGDGFGGSVAISGDTVVVGAPRDDNDLGNDSGSAYIYERDTATGLFHQSAKLTASDAEDGDTDTGHDFGGSVAISGDTVVVGAKYYNKYNIGFMPGSAYIYERPGTGWTDATQSAKLTASDADTIDAFGDSVAISGDTVVVGANSDDDLGSASGSAYIYEKPVTGWTDANQSAKLYNPFGAANERFGSSVSISGNTVVVGTNGDGYSPPAYYSAYIYERDTATGLFHQSAKLTASDGAEDDGFGRSVAISGDTVVVGASHSDDASGSAYIYERPGTGWIDATQSAKLTASDAVAYSYDYFGNSVSISGDTVVVGASGNDDLGSAYIYERPGTGWIDVTQSAKLTASDGAEDDGFGGSVAISGDTVVVGAPRDDNDLGNDSGSAYIFKAKASAVNPAIIMYLLN